MQYPLELHSEFFEDPWGHGRPRRKSWTSAPKSVFSCGSGDGDKLFDAWSSGCKGQEHRREVRTGKCMFMSFLSSMKGATKGWTSNLDVVIINGGVACVRAKRCIFLRVFALFCAFLCFFSCWDVLQTKRKFVQNSAKMCKKRSYAISPLVIPFLSVYQLCPKDPLILKHYREGIVVFCYRGCISLSIP